MIKNFALITFSFEGAPVALKLKEEGLNVVVGVIENRDDILTKIEHPTPKDPEEAKRRLSSFDGLLEKQPAEELISFLKKIPESERKEWFVFADLNHCWKYAQELAGMGFNGLFPTEEDRIFEVDRDEAKKFVQENYPGIEENQVFEFTSAEDAKSFLEGADEVYVLKGKDEDAPTIVPKSDDPEMAAKEIVAALEQYQKEFEKSGFILEVKIADAVEHTVQGVWNNGELVYVMNDIEAKPKNAGDVGELTGCSADLIFWLKEEDPLVQIGLPEVVHEMAKKHEGVFVWDAALYVSRRTNKIYFGEFCANRVGYNCFYSELSNLNQVKDWFENVSQNKNPYDNKKGLFAGSVRIFNDEVEVAKDSVRSKQDIGIIYQGKGDFWPMDVKFEEGKLLTCGYSPDTCVVTGQGNTVTELAKSIYDNLNNFTMEAKRWTYRYRGDYTATDYATSMVNRFNFGNHELYEMPDFELSADEQEKVKEIEKKIQTKFDSKLQDAQAKHQKELDGIKTEIKQILNG